MRQLIVLFFVLAPLTGGDVMAQTERATGTPATVASRSLVEQFLSAFENRDLETVTGFLAEHVVLVMPMTFSGSVEPEFVADGQAATVAYFESVFANFTQVRFVDPTITVSETGSRVFVETRGDFVMANGGHAYSNVYVFRLDIADGQIVFINEYANPVIASAALGIPLGTPMPTD